MFVRNNPRTVTSWRERPSRPKSESRPRRPAARGLVRPIKRALLAVLLDAGGAQASKAVLVDRILPGQEFLNRQRITAARLFERKQSAAHGRNHLRLAANDPTLGSRRGQIRDCQGGTVRPDDILDPRAMRFGHSNSHVLDTTGCDTTHGGLKFT